MRRPYTPLGAMMAGIAAAFGAPAMAQTCGQTSPDILVETFVSEPHYDFTYGFNEIQGLAETQNGRAHDGQGRMGNRAVRPSDTPLQYMGLTAYALSVTPTVQVQARSLGASRYCAGISSIKVRIGIERQMVYVASHYPKGSCSHQEILEHEQKHVMTNKAFAQDAKLDVEKLLGSQEYQKNIGQAYLTDRPDSYHARVESLLSEDMAKLGKLLSADLASRQAKIDSREEYERVARGCQGTTQEVVAKYLQSLRLRKPPS